MLTATNITITEADKFDGKDKWENLIANRIVPPDNAFVGSRIISDERALFNNQWKLYSSQPQLITVSASYRLFNIIEDPFEKNDLSKVRPKILEEMKETLTSYIERDVVGDMNPAHAYLHGDDRQGGIALGTPWLDGNYELNMPPSSISTFFITIWILIQAFKYYLAALLLFIVAIFYAVKKFR